MSEENVDGMRRNLEAWQSDDLEAFMAGIHPAIEWHAVLQRLVEGPQSVYRGHEGVRRIWHTYRTDLDGFEVEAQEIRDVGGDRVLFLGRIRWRGVASGIVTESPFGMAITFRDGKMFHSVDYLSHAEALEAVGLSEQDAHANP
jgi:ketosteroid isomerase-like protein